MKNLIFIFFVISSYLCHCQESNRVWIKTFGSDGADELKCLTIDKDQNVIVGGYFSNQIVLAGRVFEAKGEQDILLIKLNEFGKIIWAQQAGSNYSEKDHICELASKIATDSKGNIIIAGTFQSLAKFQDTSILSNGNTDIFIAKYNQNGDLIWVKNIGNRNADLLYDFKINDDIIYISSYHLENEVSKVISKVFFTCISSNGDINWIDEVDASASSASIEFVDGRIIHNLYLDEDLSNFKKSNNLTKYYSLKYTKNGLREIDYSNKPLLNYIESNKLNNVNSSTFTTSFGEIVTFKYLSQFNYLDTTLYSNGNWFQTAILIQKKNDIQVYKFNNINGTINDLCVVDSSLYIVGTYNLDNDIDAEYFHFGYVDAFIEKINLTGISTVTNKNIEDSNFEITLKPNPTNNWCEISIKTGSKSTENVEFIELLTSNGSVINKIENPQIPLTLNVGNLPRGKYIVSIKRNDKICNKILLVN